MSATLLTGPLVAAPDALGKVCAVRFDTQCVVIPDSIPPPSRKARFVTKTYTVPLWKRRGSVSRSPDPSDIPPPPEDGHVILKVPLPRLQTKLQSTPRSVDSPPLTPCLVHRSPSGRQNGSSRSPITERRTPSRSPVSPTQAEHLITVPLRPCCEECEAITDEARLQGDAWTVHFSRAAHYRRSLSVDSQPRTITVAGSAAAASYGSLARGIQITVDEVDKRRKSIEGTSLSSSPEPTHRSSHVIPVDESQNSGGTSSDTCLSLSPTMVQLVLSGIPEEMGGDNKDRHSSIMAQLVTNGLPEENGGDDEGQLSPAKLPQLVTNGIAVEKGDEEEDQLFPLPSPKRTPPASPEPSPVASTSSLQANHPPPRPSPAASTPSLQANHPPLRTSSAGPVLSHYSSRESTATIHFHTPQGSTTSVNVPTEPEPERNGTGLMEYPLLRPPSPGALATLVSLSDRPWRLRRSTELSHLHSLQGDSPEILIPWMSYPLHPPEPTAPVGIPTAPRTTSSTSPNTRRLLKSVSANSPKQMFVDVFKGVGAIGSNGTGLGMRV